MAVVRYTGLKSQQEGWLGAHRVSRQAGLGQSHEEVQGLMLRKESKCVVCTLDLTNPLAEEGGREQGWEEETGRERKVTTIKEASKQPEEDEENSISAVCWTGQRSSLGMATGSSEAGEDW